MVRNGKAACQYKAVEQQYSQKNQSSWRYVKWRSLRLDTGNYSWGSEAVTRRTRVIDIVCNASNNELVRPKTIVNSALVLVDDAPFKQWYLQH
ncbi:unnamed protein product [Microthlaspi erraticum]|uniref:40S ribosomal protein S8 n=1 Tax=Microthlaspi erraticum TaxID=1685480 RepID=A0A6D2KPX6_9BRAS|nr:unnamed protein product [Microthlaspi erraticum]